jgi:hypothetical protein
MSSLWDSLVTGFEAVSTTYNNNPVISDVVNGALFGAVTTAIGGGDIAEGAAWGAAGNVVAGYGDEGIFNIAGRGIAGYGIDKAMGGDGLLGGASGLLAGYLEDGVEQDRTVNNKTATSETPSTEETITPPPASEEGFMEKYGLQTAQGDGTLLGKGLLSAAAGYGTQQAAKEQIEEAAKIRDASDRNKKALDEEFQQRNLAGFRQPSMIVRNG